VPGLISSAEGYDEEDMIIALDIGDMLKAQTKKDQEFG